MIHTLYLTIEPSKRYWKSPRISRVSRSKPKISPGQALVRLNIDIPHDAIRPPEVSIKIGPEHISAPKVEIAAEVAS